MVFLTEGVRALRDTVIYLRTAISMAHNENAFGDLDARIIKLETYLEGLQQAQNVAGFEEGVDAYLDALDNMVSEVQEMLESAKNKKQKKGKRPY